MHRHESDRRARPDELANLLDDIHTLRTRLASPSEVDTAAIDAELNELAARLRASEQKLKKRKPLDIRGET